MCGVIGTWRPHPRWLDVDLSGGRPLLARRGPDSMKSWTSPDGRVELLHARLAIVDAGGEAHQPMTDPETGTTVAFNGEIYNYAELRAELTSYPYRTQSDTEAILAAYRQAGIDALSRLRGMFALVLVDGLDGTVYLARDPIGKKPFFIADWGGSTLFGSSVQALLASSRRAPAIDPESLDDYWTDGHVSPSSSIIEGCRPLMPGEVIAIKKDGKRASSYIAPAPLPQSASNQDLKDLLRVSVLRRLHNNPNPVSLLSGGIDSTVVTAAMRRETSVRALTLGALVPLTLDERYARYAARRIGVPLEIISPGIGRIEDEVEFCLDLQDEPLGMMSFFPLALLLRAVKPHGRILLSGDGGDEVFLGYGRPRDWSAGPDGEAPSADDRTGAVRCGPELPAWMSPWGRRTVTRALVGHMFTKLDRASAEQGIEVRCPLLDWDVMTFARSLDPATLVGPDRPKHLLKEQLPGWPAWFLDRPKIGFGYHLRWAWGVRRFSGLRERIEPEALDTFAAGVPEELRTAPSTWRTQDIWRHFPHVWKLLAWSAFLRRLRPLPLQASLRDAS